jgi:hypothetical protein
MTGYPILDIFFTTLYFFGWLLWLMLMFWIVWDIFRSPDLSGWAKAGWLLFVIVLPLIGVLVYLIARGKDMQERQAGRGLAAPAPYGNYYRVGGGASAGVPRTSDELANLANLHQRGVLNDEEFQRAKMRVM